jgi:hypothetical protein
MPISSDQFLAKCAEEDAKEAAAIQSAKGTESEKSTYGDTNSTNSTNSTHTEPEFGESNSLISSNSYVRVDVPSFQLDAMHGPIGDIVRRIEPFTEADPAALYVQLLAGCGAMMGHNAYFMADGAKHFPNLYTVIVGKTAKARKGTSWSRVRGVLNDVDEIWMGACVKTGAVSGEGIIEALGREAGTKELLLVESEFAAVLQASRREGSTVSSLLRNAWDGGKLSVMRRKDPIEVEDAHLSMIGHITLPELHRLLAATEISNGLANRILWTYAERRRLLPDGGEMPDVTDPCADVAESLRRARTLGRVLRSESARKRWSVIYEELSHEPAGRIGEVLSRAEAHVARLSLLFCLLDRQDRIEPVHLEAALTLWKYCDASARFIFADALRSPLATRILEVLGHGPQPLTGLHEALGRNSTAAEVNAALKELGSLIKKTKEPGPRQPEMVSMA